MKHDIDPVAFGKEIGSLIREVSQPLEARIRVLEEKQERGIRFRGKYQGADTYRPGDVVAYDESLWSCTKETGGGDRPAADSPAWALMLRGK
jgi:hypothetical protein